MRHSKGALAPFFLPLCSPRLRDDTMLKRAIEALAAGQYADALLAVEYVCRRFPSKNIPATLRAKILQACCPELTAKAWYRAWLCDPENPLLQDAMLHAWLKSGAAASVLELGPAFLPERCRAGKHTSLIQLLRQAHATPVGACWKSGDAIEGMLFGHMPIDHEIAQTSRLTGSQKMRLIVADETSRFEYDVPADGRRFRLDCPLPHGVWSVAFVSEAASQAAPKLLHGSPLVFGPPAAALENSAPVSLSSILSRQAEKQAAESLREFHVKTVMPQNPVSILIPVYRDQALAKTCIGSVLASLPLNATRAEVLVIDDASPEPELSAWLDTLAESGRLTLLRNRFNLGFIETVNRGLRHHSGHDVVLLNADTLVHGDWIDRLGAALHSAADIASVTPWSNNGEISSFPKIATASPMPTLAQLAEIDNTAAALHSAGRITDVELPSCCGFAMMMRRSVLDHIGALDGIALTRGYGEEVDWCLRARAAGYRHVAATGVFVAHSGTASFRFEKTLRVRQNRAVLVARYPHYHPEYQSFINDDPLKMARQTIRAALQQADSEWLAKAVKTTEGQAGFPRALPAALPSSGARIAVWQHRLNAASAAKILELARLIASQPALALRLLVIGEANEALWHSGVVDVLQQETRSDTTLLSDAAMVGLSGCTVLLAEHTQTAPIGITAIPLDDEFDPKAWLADWLNQQADNQPQDAGGARPATRKPGRPALQEAVAA